MHTVVVADDWPALRERLDEALCEAGYFAIQAQSGEEALGLLRSVSVDLLLARERLADIEGSVLAQVLRQRGHDELVVVLLAEGGGAEWRAMDRGVVDAVVPRSLDIEPVVRLVRYLLRPVICHAPPSAESGHTCAPARA